VSKDELSCIVKTDNHSCVYFLDGYFASYIKWSETIHWPISRCPTDKNIVKAIYVNAVQDTFRKHDDGYCVLTQAAQLSRWFPYIQALLW